MVNIETFAREQLGNKKLTPAERKAVEGIVLMAEGWNLNHQVAFGQTTSTDTNHTASQLVEQLHEELKGSLGKDIKIPNPHPEFLEMQNILRGEGFNMDPIVYLGGGKISYALLDRSVRPDYDGGLQLFEGDGFVPILERGRKTRKIEVTSWVRHVPTQSRFGVSWSEVHNFVAPEMVKVSPHLGELVGTTGAEVRVPTKDEFQFAGKLRYAHFGKANTWEWLYGKYGFGSQLIGGCSDLGGLEAVNGRHAGLRDGRIAFRLQAVLPPQKLG